MLGGCHGHYPGGSEHPPPQNTHGPTLQTHTHICSQPTQSSHCTQLFDVEFGNLPKSHKSVYHANFVAKGDLFAEGEIKKVARDGESEVVD